MGDVDFSKVHDKFDFDTCYPWFDEPERTLIDISVPGRQKIACSVNRKFTPWKTNIEFKYGDVLNWRTGYNAWESVSATKKFASGYSGNMKLRILDPASVNSGARALVVGTLVSVSLLL